MCTEQQPQEFSITTISEIKAMPTVHPAYTAPISKTGMARVTISVIYLAKNVFLQNDLL